jgi:hypothetical protein
MAADSSAPSGGSTTDKGAAVPTIASATGVKSTSTQASANGMSQENAGNGPPTLSANSGESTIMCSKFMLLILTLLLL